ncbi:MAG: NAD(P)-dependent oxidoreductase, partial [Candidatus Delongbacteria bacterium]|nr:NAD(P)-dependent oxidoreductase [Candidatus Delongbacteria bacterium]
MELIITGSDGQLGMALKAVSEKYRQYDWVFLSKKEFDITNITEMDKYFKISDRKNSIVINCAAYTDVEKAELDHENAFLINSEGPERLAELAEKYKYKLIHISTDYVFNGQKSGSYNENDIPDPVNVYGSSKLSGENAVLNSKADFVIIRVSWLYSTTHQTFLNKILNRINISDEIRVVDDEKGSPTYALDLAKDIVLITEQIASEQQSFNEVYHYCNAGSVSR